MLTNSPEAAVAPPGLWTTHLRAPGPRSLLHSWQLDGLVPTAALLLGLDNGRRAAIGGARALGSRGGQCWELPRATWHQPYLTSDNLSTTTPKYGSYHASRSCPDLGTKAHIESPCQCKAHLLFFCVQESTAFRINPPDRDHSTVKAY